MPRWVLTFLLIAAPLLGTSRADAQNDFSSAPGYPTANGDGGFSRLPPSESTGFGLPATTPAVEMAPGNNAPVPSGQRFELAETLAQVGDQYILRGDLVGDANLIMAPMYAQMHKVPPEAVEQVQKELQEYREQMIQMKLLPEAIDRKLKFLAYLRTIPTQTDPKKLEEQKKRIEQSVAKEFDRNVTTTLNELKTTKLEDQKSLMRKNPPLYYLAVAMKENGVQSREDPGFEKMLIRYGTSLPKQRQSFMEYVLGQSVLANALKQQEITHEELVEYYREKQHEFNVPTRVQWEQLSVLFKNFPDVPSAWDEIVAMGNEVLGGAPLWAVAQRRSHDKQASRGGFHDWTEYGDLTISRAIHQSLFEIPLNRLTPIIEDEEGLHIIRVTAREQAHTKPFETVQDDIRDKIHNERLNQAYTEFIAKLRQETPVITDFDEHGVPQRYARPTSSGGFSR